MPDQDNTETFQHYRVLHREDGSVWELGRGAMGVTYKAIDTNLDSLVALKVINALFLDDPGTRERFVREAKAAASLRHRNVASVYHLGHDDQSFFYAMEFIGGETVESLVKRVGPLPWRAALGAALQVARALMAAHEKHLVHRDIKPANIMLVDEVDEAAVVKLIDFGLAKSVAESSGASLSGGNTSGFLGTPLYASPEQCDEIAPDIRSDIYSLGVTLWHMLTAKPLFTGNLARVLDAHLHRQPPWEMLPADVPGAVRELLGRMLAKSREDRPQTPAELRAEIDACLQATGESDTGVIAAVPAVAQTIVAEPPASRTDSAVSGSASGTNASQTSVGTRRLEPTPPPQQPPALASTSIAESATPPVMPYRPAPEPVPPPLPPPLDPTLAMTAAATAAPGKRRLFGLPMGCTVSIGITFTVCAAFCVTLVIIGLAVGKRRTEEVASAAPPSPTTAPAGTPTETWADPTPSTAPATAPTPRAASASSAVEQWLEKGRQSVYAADWNQVINNYSRALALQPDSLEALVERADAHDVLGEYDAAKVDYTQAIAIPASDPLSHAYRAIAYGGIGQLAQAGADVQAGLGIQPRDAHDYCIRGNLYFAMQQYDKAVQDYTDAIRLQPDFAVAYCNRANAYGSQRQFGSAEQDLNTAIRQRPALSISYRLRGILYNLTRRQDAAIQDFTEALRLCPRDIQSVIYRGSVYQSMNNHNAALRDFDAAIRINPQNRFAYLFRAVTYQKLNRPADAKRDQQTAQKLLTNPNP